MYTLNGLKIIQKTVKANQEMILMVSSVTQNDVEDGERVSATPVLFVSMDGVRNSISYKTRGASNIRTLYRDNFWQIRDIKIVKKNYFAKYDTVYDNKKPLTSDKYVGIELEFVSQLEDSEINDLLVENDLETFCQVKEDGSVDGDDDYQHAHEICILAKESQVAGIVTKVCKLLKGTSIVNSSCGMHVHLDMRNRDRTKAYAHLFKAQKLLYSMVPYSRQEGTYCEPTHDYMAFRDQEVTSTRYVGINTQAFSSHKTIEVRIHSGSLDATKIINWVKLLVRIVDSKSAKLDTGDVEAADSFSEIKRVFRLRGKLAKYAETRILKFAKQHKNSDYRLEDVA